MKAVNLLPNDQRTAARSAVPSPSTSGPSGDGFGAFMVLGALAFAVVAVAAYVLTANTISDRKTELAKVRNETKQLEAQAAALRPYAEFKQLATQRVSTVTQLATSRFDWERSLRDISRALPRDVHLKQLKGTVSSGSASAGAVGGNIRQAVQAPAIELIGCATSQSAVARLMARLRAVRGVTRVSLVKSDKDGAAATSAGTARNGGEIRLCRKHGPPAFELVMFFERAPAAPSATPAVPGAAPGAAGTTPATPGAQPAQGTQSTPASGAAGQPAPGAQPGTQTPTTPAQSTQGVSAP